MNVLDRDAKVERDAEKRDARIARDAELVAINEKFAPELNKLRDAARKEREAVWAKWRERRSES